MAVAAASTFASCAGSDVLDRAGGRERYRDSVQRVQAQENARAQPHQDKRQSSPSTAESVPGSGGEGSGGAVNPGESVGTTGDDSTSGTKADQAPGASRPASSCADDMAGDMESSGSAPAYADLTRGCVRAQDDGIVLEASTAGGLPARMPDPNTHLTIAFSIELPSGPKSYITAESSDAGWTVYLNRGRDRRELPAPVISGSRLRVTLPASEVGAARRVLWNVESSWLKSTLTSTSYAFDDAPNGGTLPFDRG